MIKDSYYNFNFITDIRATYFYLTAGFVERRMPLSSRTAPKSCNFSKIPPEQRHLPHPCPPLYSYQSLLMFKMKGIESLLR